MKSLKLTKLIASILVIALIIAINPIGASAEWKQNSHGWWNTEGSSWSVGWKEIDGKWYYFGQDGYMAHDTTVDGYNIGSDGAWIQNTQNNLSTTKTDNTSTSENANFNLDNLVGILKTKFNNVALKDVEEDFLPTTRKLITIKDEFLTVYVYENNQEMEKDATNLIKHNGSYEKTLANGKSEVICPDWTYVTYFYKKGNLIIQYSGENQTIISDLKAIFGEAFK